MTDSVVARAVDPLAGKVLVRIPTWAEWKERWAEAKTYEECEGLLFSGCKFLEAEMAGEDWGCMRFYFAVASGYRPRGFSADKFDEDRRRVRAKAWEVVVNAIFRVKEHDPQPEFRWRQLLTADRLDILLDFFVPPAAPNWASGHNLPYRYGSHDQKDKLTLSFLKRFVELVWDCRAGIPPYLQDRNRMEKFVGLLILLRQLDVLRSGARHLTVETMDFLRALALRKSPEGWDLAIVFARNGNEEGYVAGVLILLEAQRAHGLK